MISRRRSVPAFVWTDVRRFVGLWTDGGKFYKIVLFAQLLLDNVNSDGDDIVRRSSYTWQLIMAENEYLDISRSLCEKICDQIEHRIACPDGQHTFSRIRSKLGRAEAGLQSEINRLAGQLAADPESRLRSKGKHAPIPDTRSILSESLLGVGNA